MELYSELKLEQIWPKSSSRMSTEEYPTEILPGYGSSENSVGTFPT